MRGKAGRHARSCARDAGSAHAPTTRDPTVLRVDENRTSPPDLSGRTQELETSDSNEHCLAKADREPLPERTPFTTHANTNGWPWRLSGRFWMECPTCSLGRSRYKGAVGNRWHALALASAAADLFQSTRTGCTAQACGGGSMVSNGDVTGLAPAQETTEDMTTPIVQGPVDNNVSRYCTVQVGTTVWSGQASTRPGCRQCEGFNILAEDASAIGAKRFCRASEFGRGRRRNLRSGGVQRAATMKRMIRR